MKMKLRQGPGAAPAWSCEETRHIPLPGADPHRTPTKSHLTTLPLLLARWTLEQSPDRTVRLGQATHGHSQDQKWPAESTLAATFPFQTLPPPNQAQNRFSNCSSRKREMSRCQRSHSGGFFRFYDVHVDFGCLVTELGYSERCQRALHHRHRRFVDVDGVGLILLPVGDPLFQVEEATHFPLAAVQYSSGNSRVVADRSASVIIHSVSPASVS